MTYDEREARDRINHFKQRNREARQDARTFEGAYVRALKRLREVLEQERRRKEMQQP